MKFTTMDCHPFDPSTGIRADQTIQLLAHKSKKAYPAPLRRVDFFDEKTQLDLVFLSNRLDPLMATQIPPLMATSNSPT